MRINWIFKHEVLLLLSVFYLSTHYSAQFKLCEFITNIFILNRFILLFFTSVIICRLKYETFPVSVFLISMFLFLLHFSGCIRNICCGLFLCFHGIIIKETVWRWNWCSVSILSCCLQTVMMMMMIFSLQAWTHSSTWTHAIWTIRRHMNILLSNWSGPIRIDQIWSFDVHQPHVAFSEEEEEDEEGGQETSASAAAR